MKRTLNELGFAILLLIGWAYYILFAGWYRHFFCPHVITFSTQAELDADLNAGNFGPRKIYNGRLSAAAKTFAQLEGGQFPFTITERAHWFYYTEIYYLDGPRWKARLTSNGDDWRLTRKKGLSSCNHCK